MSTFELNGIDPEKCFIIHKKDIEKRLDPFYYIPSIIELESKVKKLNPKPLRYYVKHISSGATPKTTEAEKYYSDAENGVPFLRVQNLSPSGLLELEECKYINWETHENYLKRSQVSGGDLLVKITGVGRMAVASVAPEGFVGNTNQHMVVIKTESKEVSEILAAYLNTDIGEALASRRATGGTRPALDYPALLSIPIVYDKKILEIHREAIKIKEEKETEAEELLESIDNYLLAELGITLPEKDNSLEKRIFQVNFSDITQNRWNSEYHQIYFADCYKSMSKLYDLVELSKLSLEIFQGVGRNLTNDNTYTLLKVKNIKKYNKIDYEEVEYVQNVPKFKLLKKNDIISPFIGEAIRQIKFSIFDKEDGNWTVDNNTGIIRLNQDLTNPFFICQVLSSKIGKVQILQLIGGGGVPFLGAYNVKKFKIPLPPIEKQDEIAEYIKNIRDMVQKLQDESLEVLGNAKKEIEKMILGE